VPSVAELVARTMTEYGAREGGAIPVNARSGA
jgi:hypothetical protein